MAQIIRRIWTSQGPTGRKVKHVAWGYTLQVNGTREKRFSSEWGSESDALAALAERQKAIAAGQLTRTADKTLGAVVAEYLAYKASNGKRSLEDDQLILERKLLPALGADTLVRKISGAAIAQYEKGRTGQVKPGTIANELSVLRHLLRLAKRWGYLNAAPRSSSRSARRGGCGTWSPMRSRGSSTPAAQAGIPTLRPSSSWR